MLTTYILFSLHLCQIYTSFSSVRFRNTATIQLFCLTPLCAVIVIHIIFAYVTNPFTHCYNNTLMSFIEVESKKGSKYIFLEYCMIFLTQHFLFSFVPMESCYHLVTFPWFTISLFPSVSFVLLTYLYVILHVMLHLYMLLV